MKIEELVKKLLKLKENYYEGTPLISDDEFDAMEEELREIDPHNAYFSIVGTNVKGSNKIKHTFPMRSCAKAKTVEDVVDWLDKIRKHGHPLIAMPKIDGLSCSIKYVNGNISYITTRGDGEIGQDITWLKDYLNIPQTTNPDYERSEVRGEIYLPKDTELETDGKPLRNIAAGLVNRKDNKTNCEYLKFVAYYYKNSEDTIDLYFSEDLEYLKELGFDVVEYFPLFSEKDLTKIRDTYLNKLREEFKYETDGLVIQMEEKSLYEEVNSNYEISHHNYYNIALKPPSETAKTMLIGINWEVSRNGNIIPVAMFEPIYLGNKEIKNATLNNYENVEKLDLHFGDRVEIANANEVIPFFVGKVSNGSGKSFLVTECPSCRGKLIRNGVHMQCTNEGCPDQRIKKLTYWCTESEMDSVSEATIRALYEWTFVHDYVDLYRLKDCDRSLLKDIEGFGDSKIDNLLAQIEKSRKVDIVEFLNRLGIDLVGKKAVKKLGIKSFGDFWDFKDKTYVIGQNLIKYRDENAAWIDELIGFLEIEEAKYPIGNLPKVCMTGKGPAGRKELEEKLISMGYMPIDSISKDTNILVCEDVNGSSSKLTKAKKLGIKIISYEEFFR